MHKFFTMSLIIMPLFSIPVMADSYPDSPSCYRPSKPYEFTSQWEIDSFYNDVDTYRACIEDFVEEQQDEISEHQEAISDAIDEWNDFVNYELN